MTALRDSSETTRFILPACLDWQCETNMKEKHGLIGKNVQRENDKRQRRMSWNRQDAWGRKVSKDVWAVELVKMWKKRWARNMSQRNMSMNMWRKGEQGPTTSSISSTSKKVASKKACIFLQPSRALLSGSSATKQLCQSISVDNSVFHCFPRQTTRSMSKYIKWNRTALQWKTVASLYGNSAQHHRLNPQAMPSHCVRNTIHTFQQIRTPRSANRRNNKDAHVRRRFINKEKGSAQRPFPFLQLLEQYVLHIWPTLNPYPQGKPLLCTNLQSTLPFHGKARHVPAEATKEIARESNHQVCNPAQQVGLYPQAMLLHLRLVGTPTLPQLLRAKLFFRTIAIISIRSSCCNHLSHLRCEAVIASPLFPAKPSQSTSRPGRAAAGQNDPLVQTCTGRSYKRTAISMPSWKQNGHERQDGRGSQSVLFLSRVAATKPKVVFIPFPSKGAPINCWIKME